MWEEKNNKLHKEFKFKDFKQALLFMNLVGDEAEKRQHHPSWCNEYNKVIIDLTTHDAGSKVTDKDRDLSEAIDRIYSNTFTE